MNLVKILLLLVAAVLFLAHWNYERTPDDPILDMGDFFLRYSAKNATILVRVAKVEAFARTDKLALKLLSPQIKKIKNLVGESDELITEGEKILDAIDLAQKKEDYKTAAKESFEIEKKIRGIKEKNLKANELYEELKDFLGGGSEDEKKEPKISI